MRITERMSCSRCGRFVEYPWETRLLGGTTVCKPCYDERHGDATIGRLDDASSDKAPKVN